MIYPTLEKYRGAATRFTCPNCGRRGEFTRYIREDGSHISDDVGRCNRASCGYHYSPGQFYDDNPDLRTRQMKHHNMKSRGRRRGTMARAPSNAFVIPDHLAPMHLAATIGGYQDNSFVQFLFDLFPNDPEDIEAAIRAYRVGTEDRFTVFPVIDRWQRFCKAQLIQYDRATGNRIKEKFSTSSLQSRLKARRSINQDFETDKNVFFGEHLLAKFPGRPIAIVESPKTAVIASICKGVVPDLVWLACMGKDNLNADRLERLGRERTFHLYPDAKGYEKWLRIGSAARKRGLMVDVSDSIQKIASENENVGDFDLADLLIREQTKRNDPAIREAFRVLIEERLSILTNDRGLTLYAAEAEILATGFYENAMSEALGLASNCSN